MRLAIGAFAYVMTVILCLYFCYLGLVGIFAGGWLILAGLLAIGFASYIWTATAEVLDEFIRGNKETWWDE